MLGLTTKYDFATVGLVLSFNTSCPSGTPSPSVSTSYLFVSISSSSKSYSPSLSVSKDSKKAFA